MSAIEYRVTPCSSIADLAHALEAGAITSVQLADMFLQRIAYYDRATTTLNSVPLLNPNLFTEARDSDLRRARGESRGRLDGVPFIVKDSFKVAGMPVANGSPAFEKVIASSDAATVEFLREAGAVLIGKTTMPPMAAGGMQLGNFGRARSPYNPDYMPAAWVSGSSNGSAVAVASSFAAFGLGEETLSSGRSPASNCALATYTPSRGLISIRGNWPLLGLRDVIAPYARTLEDLFQVLNVIVRDDSDSTGDLWRSQKVVQLPPAVTIRPTDYLSLRDPEALKGKVVGVPRIFVGKDSTVSSPVTLRPSIKDLWEQAEEDLRALGATVLEVDPPVFYEFDKLRVGARDAVDRGYWPAEFSELEFSVLCGAGWDEFLRTNKDPHLSRLEQVDTSTIYPDEFYGADPAVNPMPRFGYEEMERDAVGGSTPSLRVPGIDQVLAGLERFRTEFLERWMTETGVDLLAFPAASNVAPADADTSLRSALDAWLPGAAFSQGGWCLRPLGIPAVQVSMGTTSDIDMPVGVTFAGRAYSDNLLLSAAYAYEQRSLRRTEPKYAPLSVGEIQRVVIQEGKRNQAVGPPEARLTITVTGESPESVTFTVSTTSTVAALSVSVDGERIINVALDEELTVRRPSRGRRSPVSCIQAGIIIAHAELEGGGIIGGFAEFDLPSLHYADTQQLQQFDSIEKTPV